MESLINHTGHIENPFIDAYSVYTSLKNVEAAIEDADTEEEIIELETERETLTDMLDTIYWEIGTMIGYESLVEIRKFWGIQSSMHNTLQERYYKTQKATYEESKRGKKYFTTDDRAIIHHYKTLNEQHLSMRSMASEMREILSNMIEAAFPDAPFDMGWDETWVEPNKA